MTSSVACENCGTEFDLVGTRYRCPLCGYRMNCCEGEAQPAPRAESDAARVLRMFDEAVVEPRPEYAECEWCHDPIARLQGGLWEHALDPGLDEDHAPELIAEPSFDDEQLELRPAGESAVGPRVVDVDLGADPGLL